MSLDAWVCFGCGEGEFLGPWVWEMGGSPMDVGGTPGFLGFPEDIGGPPQTPGCP